MLVSPRQRTLPRDGIPAPTISSCQLEATLDTKPPALDGCGPVLLRSLHSRRKVQLNQRDVFLFHP